MHPTTLWVWGDTNWLLKPLVLQSPFGILFSNATTGHILYTLFTVTTSGTWWPFLSAGVKSNSQPSCEAWASGFQAHFWTLHGYILVPEAASHPFPPFPPRLSCFLLRGTCKSHIRNRCSHPTRRSGVKITCSHTCLICCSCEEPCSSSLKNQNIHIISCHPTQGKHDHLPFTKDRPKQNNL